MKVLQKYGSKGEEAAETELTQILKIDVLKPIHANSLLDDEKKGHDISDFLAEKRGGTIKARQCADGQTLRDYIDKEEAALPQVMTEAVFLTCIIEAKEWIEVAVVDLPGAFLHAENEDNIVMFMKGRLVELMVMVTPQTNIKFITIEKGQKILYVKVQKACYDMLKSALFFY